MKFRRTAVCHVNNGLAVICVLLAIFGIGIASLAIQQWEINKFYNTREDI